MPIKVSIDRLPELEEMVDVFDGVGVDVGFAGEHSGGLSNAHLAYILEMGSPARNLPARPALEPGIRENKQEILGVAEQAARAAARADRNRKQVFLSGMQMVADACVNAVKKKILQNEFAPLAPATVKRKGHDQAWIDTGELFDSISASVVVKKGRRRARS